MSKIGADNSRTVRNPGDEPFNTVAQVTASYFGIGFAGSGVVIGSDVVLSAGHVFYDTAFGPPLTLTPQQLAVTRNFNPQSRRSDIDGLDQLRGNFSQTFEPRDDLVLIELSTAQPRVGATQGLIGFVSPGDAVGRSIRMAGYPVDDDDSTASEAPDQPNNGATAGEALSGAHALYTASGKVQFQGDGRMFYDTRVDTFPGQSGGGVWMTRAGDPVLAGVHAYGTARAVQIEGEKRRNSGTLFTDEDVRDIMQLLEGEPDPNGLPRNFLVGSNSRDVIVGTHRRDRIEGEGALDRLTGGGADDELDGGDGRSDRAVFSGRFREYVIEEANGRFEWTVEHSRGSRSDGTDALRSIEFLVFSDGRRPEPSAAGLAAARALDGAADPRPEGFVAPVARQDGPDRSWLAPVSAGGDSFEEVVGALRLTLPANSFDGDVAFTLSLVDEPFAVATASQAQLSALAPGALALERLSSLPGAAFGEAPTAIEEVRVLLDGDVVGEFDGGDLVPGPLGQQITGTIEGLVVAPEARNLITVEVAIEGVEDVVLEAVVTTGQADALEVQPEGPEREPVVEAVLAVDTLEFATTDEVDVILGNDIGNVISVTDPGRELVGAGGDDLFVLDGAAADLDGSAPNVIVGGAGVDTVRYDVAVGDDATALVAADDGGAVVGGRDRLVGVEFIEFLDARLVLPLGPDDEPARVPVISVLPPPVVEEPAEGGAPVVLEVSLSSEADEEVSVRFEVVGLTASLDDADADFAPSDPAAEGVIGLADGRARIPLGDVLADELAEGVEALEVRFFDPIGATFAGGAAEEVVEVEIAANDTVVFVPVPEPVPEILPAGIAVIEPGPSEASLLRLPVTRIGDVEEALTVAFEILPGEEDTAGPNDFGGERPTGTIAFAPGALDAFVEVAVVGDAVLEGDETFTIVLSPLDDEVELGSDPLEVVILEDRDGDGVPDALDNAVEVANPDQRDTDGDGYGNVVDPDLDGNGFVNALDAAAFAEAFGGRVGQDDAGPIADADFDGDGFVNALDARVLAELFGGAPGPSFIDLG